MMYWRNLILLKTAPSYSANAAKNEFLKAFVNPTYSRSIREHRVDPSGFEPEASCLQGKRSTPELRARGKFCCCFVVYFFCFYFFITFLFF